jgi:hypothetical protein
MKYELTSNGMTLEAVADHIHSARGFHAVAKAVAFGASSSLLNQASQLQKSINLAKRIEETQGADACDTFKTSDRYLSQEEKTQAAAERLRSIELILATDHRTSDLVIVEVQAGEAKPVPMDTIAKLVEATGRKPEEIMAMQQKQANAQAKQVKDGEVLANTMLFSAEGNQDVYVKPDMVLKALQRTQDWLCTWSQPDYAELVLLKADIELFEDAVNSYEDYMDRAGEGSTALDNEQITG